MITSVAEILFPSIMDVQVTDDTLSVDLDDGRTISVPLLWYPRLMEGMEAEKSNWRLIGNGEGIHWADLDEDISIVGLIAGKPSGESRCRSKNGLKRDDHLSSDIRSEIAEKVKTQDHDFGLNQKKRFRLYGLAFLRALRASREQSERAR